MLEHDVVEQRFWHKGEEPPCHMFVDARSSPPRCAAILVTNKGEVLYTDGKPADKFMQKFKQRKDKQIMTLEVMAIAVGLSTFAEQLRDHKVIIFSDNTGAEVACVCPVLQIDLLFSS